MTTPAVLDGALALSELPRIGAEQRGSAVLRMLRDSSGDERQAVLRVGAELVQETDLVRLLREEGDDVARNAGLEMLKLRGRRALPALLHLLADRDDDVVMQAVQLIDHIGDGRAWPQVRPLLRHGNVNVVQAVIAAAPRIGSRNAAVDLLSFLEGDPWLQMTAIDSLGRLRSRFALPFLRRLIGDPMLSDFAAEALARIGGVVAVHVLAAWFVSHHADVDSERWLGLLSCALSDLERPSPHDGLREVLRSYLHTPLESLAAACLLALGPGSDDSAALDVLQACTPAVPLPLCLTHRSDLIPALLSSGPPAREWGFALARSTPDRVSDDLLERALLINPPSDPALLADLAFRVRSVRSRIFLFLAASQEGRALLRPNLCKSAAEVAAIVASETIDPADRLLLLEIAQADPATISGQICELDPKARLAVLSELSTAAAAEQLPWRDWISTDRDTYVPLFIEVVVRCQSARLRPLLHELLREEASPILTEAAAALSDRESVPLLIAAYDSAPPLNRAFVLEALGEIGGAEARSFLRQVAFESPASGTRPACRAFARSASVTDRDDVERLLSHGDWAVRLAAVEALGRLGLVDRPSLKNLLADPSAAVAQRACAVLGLAGREE